MNDDPDHFRITYPTTYKIVEDLLTMLLQKSTRPELNNVHHPHYMASTRVFVINLVTAAKINERELYDAAVKAFVKIQQRKN